ncbi:MAG: AraC family transcriptional regulator [Rhizobiales bacterium]|nr:AraC family transcriptional regulator [Hyphomicrobiales bacterium]
MQETREYWRHPCFHDLGLLKARFTRHRYNRHTHPTYVIALITDGCERVRVGNETVMAPAGTVLVVNPEEWHDGEAGAAGGWAYRTFYPSVPLLTEIAGELGQNRPPVFSRRLIEDSDIAQAMAVAHEGSASGDTAGAETSMLAALRLLILRYGDWGGRSEQADTSGSRRRLSLYEQVIEDNLNSDLGLQKLALAAGVTRFQVIRDFKKLVDLTPAAFIRNRKLRRASALIEQGLSLAAAAAEAGFSDQSHLSRTFRAAHGITPGMFKRAG